MVAKKAAMVIPTPAKPFPILVTIQGIIEKAPATHRYCVKDHEPTRVKNTTACPHVDADGVICGNSEFKSFRTGVEAGGKVQLFGEEKGKADHSKFVITAHPADEFSEEALVQGTVYRIAPQPGQEAPFIALMRVIEQSPDRAFVTTWGWTADKTHIWRLGVAMGNLVMSQVQHPDNVKQLAGPVGDTNQGMFTSLDKLLAPKPFVRSDYVDNQAAAKEAAKALGIDSTPTVETPTDFESELLSAAALLDQEEPKKPLKRTTTRKTTQRKKEAA